MSTINYTPFTTAVLNETIGWTSAAGYLEGKITKIDTRKNTGMYVSKRRSFGDAVMSEREFERLALTIESKGAQV